MLTLLIDNYDSFTYNLFQLLAEVNGAEPIVVRNDEASWEELARLEFDNVVISPGPGRPERPRDFGVCAEAIRRAEVPLLGVCLGHQGIGWVNGGAIVAAPEARHGRISSVRHRGSPLFAGLPEEFDAVRYHSLCVAEPLPGCLEPIATSADGVLMALAHRSRPQWGVQFHPESICTDLGARLLANFRDLTATVAPPAAGQPRRVAQPLGRGAFLSVCGKKAPQAEPVPPAAPPAALELKVRRLERPVDAEAAFAALFAESDPAFWLDSSRAEGEARFSFLGAGDGPLGARVSCDVGAGTVTVERGESVEERRESIFAYLDREMRRLRIAAAELPFDLNCGFVGWLGYELKGDCGGDRAHASPLPDANLVLADRLVAIDHREGHTYVLALAESGRAEQAQGWVEASTERLAALPPPMPPGDAGAAEAIDQAGDRAGGPAEPVDQANGSTAAAARSVEPTSDPPAASTEPPEFRLRRSHDRYLEDVEVCRRRLAEGETYEVCLTNKIAAATAAEPLALYRRLRRDNPSPYSAFLRFGETTVLSSSPERFLRIGRDGAVEAKPIKGTSRRAEDPAEDARLAAELRASEKDRAENLMVTDLLRNDLGAVCEVGSVAVPRLMEVESHGPVHHLVSTVRGQLREGLGPAACVRACFPGGSMTGAPKKRTMEIIDQLEGEARGVYSGAIGYFGLGGGCDLSIAIRTIVLDGGQATIGIGGAVVAQSEPEDEYQESLLKGLAPMKAIDRRADPGLL